MAPSIFNLIVFDRVWTRYYYILWFSQWSFCFGYNWALTVPLFTLIQTQFSLTDSQIITVGHRDPVVTTSRDPFVLR